MIDLSIMLTEQRNGKTLNLDEMPIIDALKIMNEEDGYVHLAIANELVQIEKAIKLTIDALTNDGRLIYIGAGTSGRLGILDAVECPPTFGTDPNKVIGIIAGGEKAFKEAIEGVEDSIILGVEDLKKISLRSNDIVVGITASGRTPYVIAAIEYANSIGCKTIGISCNKNSHLGSLVTIPIEVEVGPEVITGSTRLKAGTAQKMILNMISTMAMVGIGKVYQNLMVDVQLNNQKLQTRAENIIMVATGVDREVAKEFLKLGNGSVKIAITMLLLNCDYKTAKERLSLAGGHIRKTLKIKERGGLND